MISCNILTDILALYLDESVSAKSKKEVEEHLESCESCRKLFDEAKKDMETSNSKRIDKDIDYLKKFRVKNKTIKRAFIITGVALGVLLLIIGSYIGVLSIGFAPSSKDFAYTANYKDGNYGISLDYNNRAVVGARSVRIFQNEKKENVVEVQIKTVPDWLVPDFFGRVTKFDWGFDENAFYEYPDTAELQSNCDDFTVIIICSDKNIVIPKEEFLAQKQE